MRAHQFLLEYDRSREQQRIESLPAYQTRLKQDPGFSLEQLESADPTPQKIYVPRLATWWLRGAKLEDLISRGADALEKFAQLKQKNLLKPEHKDINGFKQFTEFETTLTRYQLPGATEQPQDRGQFKQIYRDDQLIVVQLLDQTAARWWGQNTQWCTAAKNNNQFDHYHRKGPIYVIIDRVANAKYQYWWHDNDEYDMQFMDAQDQDYDPRKLRAFAQLQKIFQPLCSHIMWNSSPTNSAKLAAVQKNSWAIRWISNPTEPVQLAAVQKDGTAIKWITDPSVAVQLAAVQKWTRAIQLISNPTEPVQLAAVQQDGLAIQWIRKPSEPVQLAAVQQNGYAILYITNPSEPVQLAAVQQTGYAIQWITNPSEPVQLAAVQRHGEAIRWIRNPSEAAQLAAVQRNPWAMQWIQNPTPKVQALYRRLTGAK